MNWRSMLPEMYEKIKCMIKEDLVKAYSFALGPLVKHSSYLTVTCHFIDSTWNLRSLVLSSSRLVNDHTAKYC